MVYIYIFVNPPESDNVAHAEEPYPSIDPGIYESNQVIYLSTNEEGGVIYYTLEPDGENFNEYTGEPIILDRSEALLGKDGLLVIRAFTRVNGKEDSAIVGFVYGMDNVVAIPDDGELTYNGESQIGIWGSDCYTLADVRVAQDAKGTLEAADGVDENGDAAVTNVGTYLVTAKIHDGLVWRLDPIEDGDSEDDIVAQADDSEDYDMYGFNTTTDDQAVVITVAPASIEDCEIGTIEDQTYDGKEKMPEPVVIFADMTLVKDRDYTLSYENNVEVGKATVTITGIGNFKDSVAIEFTIVSAAEDKPEDNTPAKPAADTPKAKVPSTGDTVGTVAIVIAITGALSLAATVIARRRRIR